MQSFDEFFRRATGRQPHEFQRRIARDGLPDVLRAAGSAGRAAVIVAWLWRRVHGPDPAGTPRRLILALPPGALTVQTANDVRTWLANLDLAGDVALHVVLGSQAANQGDWREDMHMPAIVVGPVDYLVSGALNRGFGHGRTFFPIDFALLTNGAHWVIDEPRRCPQTTVTLRRLAGFTARYGTAEPFGLTCLSPDEIADAFRRVDTVRGGSAAMIAAARQRHRPGTLTLVAANTVRTAQEVYRQLRAGPIDCTLLHARFRGTELAAIVPDVLTGGGSRIVVATQVVAAGLDLDPALVVTEDAGRATRQIAVIRQAEFETLFDTSKVPVSGDVDIAPYVRDGADLDVEMAWATWTPGENGAPDPEVRWPAPEYRCRVSIGDAVALAGTRAVWRMDQASGQWTRVTGQPSPRLHPGELLLVNADLGGYSTELGFDPSASGVADDSPVLLTPDEQAARADPALAAAAVPDGTGVPAEAPPRREWQSLDEHSERVRDQAAALIRVLAPRIPPEAARSVVVAGWLHDVGKAHPTWQDALCALAEDGERDEVAAGRPWAKSGGSGGRLEFSGGVAFRHELASLLLLDGPLHDLLAEAPDEDLARFLVLAHHGQLRVQVHDQHDAGETQGGAAGDGTSADAIRGLAQDAVTAIPAMLGHPAATLTVDLGQFRRDGERSWASAIRGILDRYGPLRLAYMETLVRVADWRASGGRQLPE